MPGLNGSVENGALNMQIEKEVDLENKVPEAAVSATPEAAVSVTQEEGSITLPIKVEVGQGHPERKRRASDELSVDSCMTKTSDGVDKDRDDDDDNDNDDDDDDKLVAGHNYDPERLKAFNMFVRLFVDENLDRMVPISKQPKDKINAILEACDRQFIEFHERSRKRIRTYLKSCRRMRRTKDQNGWDSQMRPTPPHLTSAAAEQLLAQACENESINAKRMRMGLEPLPANWNTGNTTPTSNSTTSSVSSTSSQSQPITSQPVIQQPSTQPQQPARQTAAASTAQVDRQTVAADYMRQTPPHAFRPPHELSSPFFSNGNNLFRPGFSSYQHPAHQHTPVIQHTTITSPMQNGPTDLSMKSKSGQPGKNQLNQSEVATIKQLIAGYRESAAFLYRSADELEQLLLQQN